MGMMVMILVISALSALAVQKKGPSKLELDGAEHRLKKFEQTVEKSRGKPFKLRYVEQEALRRIKALHEAYPNHPQVKDMVSRARKALIASKGKNLEITEEMLAYRMQTKRMIEKFSGFAEVEWNHLLDEIKSAENPIMKAFPRPSPRKVSLLDLKERWFVCDKFVYPANEFSQNGRQYVYVGKPSTGFYFFDLNSPAWGGAYEAVRRFRHQISGDLPEGMKWTVVGKISGIERLIPEGGKEKVRKSQMGWLVEPVAIYIPGYTLTRYDPKSEIGGHFSAEDQMEKIKNSLFTVTSVPREAGPGEVARAYVTAIKEKNSKLWFDLIDPARLKTPNAISRAWYHWELHQHRWKKYFVHAEFSEPEIEVLKGFDDSNDLESWLLTDTDKSKIKKHEDPLLERATIWVRFYDERGRQVGSPSPFFLRRYDKKRWFSEKPAMPN
jgi:hypothetical protein